MLQRISVILLKNHCPTKICLIYTIKKRVLFNTLFCIGQNLSDIIYHSIKLGVYFESALDKS